MPRFDDTAVQAVLNARRIIGTADFPGTQDITIGFRVLSDREIDAVRFQAQMYVEKQCKRADISLADFANIDPESINREQQRQALLAAAVDPESSADKPIPFFANIDQVRELDSVLVSQLWEQYQDFCDAVNPRLDLSEEEVAELAASLKGEQLASAILAHFGRDTLASLVRFLASRLETSAVGKSSISTTSTTE